MTATNGTLKPDAFLGNALGGYQPGIAHYLFHPAIREGWMSWWDIPAMLRSPTVRIGLRTLKAPLFSVKWSVEANDQHLQGFVDSTLKQFWLHDLGAVLDLYYAWGTVPAEVCYTHEAHRNLMRFSHIEPVYHVDTRVRHRGRNVEAFVVASAIQKKTGQSPWIKAPKCFWLAHDKPIGSPYGRSRLVGAWSPWMEKEGAKGGRDIRRLWMLKNAGTGGIMYFPPGGSFIDANGNVHTNEDYAREAVEKAEFGAVWAFPSTVDPETKQPQWRYEPPKINGQAGDLLQYPKDLDSEILWGMGVFPELVRAMETGGGWSGRSVPLLIFLSAADEDVRNIIDAVDKWIIRPLVMLNFGPKAHYAIEPESLVPKAPAEEGEGMPGQPGQQPGGGTSQPLGKANPSGGNPLAMLTGGKPGAQKAGIGPVKMSGIEAVEVLSVQPDDGFVPLDGGILDVLLQDRSAVSLSAAFDPAKHPHGKHGYFVKKGEAHTESHEETHEDAPNLLNRAHEAANKALDRLPAPIAHAVRGYFKLIYATHRAGHKLAHRIARENGASETEAANIAAVCSATDAVLGGKILPLTISTATGNPAAGAASSLIPAGSLAYAAFATARNWQGTWQAAQKAVQDVLLSGEGGPFDLSSARRTA